MECKLKILFVSTHTSGGATVAAERQRAALVRVGHDVKHLALAAPTASDSPILSESDHWVLLNSASNTMVNAARGFDAYLEYNRSDVSNTFLSCWMLEGYAEWELLNYLRQEAFDVIHIHWASFIFNQRLASLLSVLKVPVVITLHDMNYFTGICHYSAGCVEYRNSCTECHLLARDPLLIAKRSLALRTKSMQELKPKFISPSNWLADEFLSSSMASKADLSVEVIRNCLDLSFFYPVKSARKQELRQRFGFGDSEIVLISGAQNNHELRKGYSKFVEIAKLIENALLRCHPRPVVRFVTFGGASDSLELSLPNVMHTDLGTIEALQVAELMQVSDGLIFTSVEENFANIILEALMCGCPVFSFRVGGAPEIVVDGVNGLLGDQNNLAEFANRIFSCTVGNEASNIKSRTLTWQKENFLRYSFDVIQEQLLACYDEAIVSNEW